MSAGIPVLPGHDAAPAEWGPGWQTHWRQEAACLRADPDTFFPPDGRHVRAKAEAERRARGVCGGCTVRHECLAVALLRGEEHGVWGGLTAEERRRLAGRRTANAQDALALADRLLGEPIGQGS